ncbi:MAG: ATP phosphoribosyltransferase [Sedimentisphaerales bacterium]|jgi:ATP phosphoribosyltransferase|nr:ATP phosphoribosyltransferase [Sedimentisphaerales bacterium]
MGERLLRLGIPAGSLQKATFELFNRAGFRLTESSRNYWPVIDDPEIKPICLRAQEMARYVYEGVLDAGITGYDWIMENGCDVVEVCELAYSKSTRNPARWVLAVPEDSKVSRPEDLAGGLIATELVNVTKRYFAERSIDVRVEFSWGATEVKGYLVDGIVELTETGASLRANNLRIVDTVITSTTRLIANRNAWQDPYKREKIENIGILLTAAIEGLTKVGLKMNVRKADLEMVLRLLPAEKSPTISNLVDPAYVAVEVIVDEKVERALVPALKRAGASGIITYPLNKVIH